MKINLRTKELEEAFFDGKHLIGIKYPHHFSDLITQIYHHMALHFVNTGEPILYIPTAETQTAKNTLFDTIPTPEQQYMQVFRTQDPKDQTIHLLYENRRGTHYMVQSKDNFDYLWLVSEVNAPEEYCRNLSQQINQLPDVHISTKVNINKLKNSSYLIL